MFEAMSGHSIIKTLTLPFWVSVGMIIGYCMQLFYMQDAIPGIIPRTVAGLAGIGLAPWWHGDIDHLLANLAGVVGLLTLLSIEEPRYKTLIFFCIYLLTNILVWIFARQVNHIGMSGLLYGVSGFLMTKGFVTYNARTMVIAMITIMFYGGTFYAVLPFQEGISWESHLFGFLSGSGLAIYIYRNIPEEYPVDSNHPIRKDYDDFIHQRSEKDF